MDLKQFMIWKHWDELGPDDDSLFDWIEQGFDEDEGEYEPPPYIFDCEVLSHSDEDIPENTRPR